MPRATEELSSTRVEFSISKTVKGHAPLKILYSNAIYQNKKKEGSKWIL
jgi:hypothetical protein